MNDLIFCDSFLKFNQVSFLLSILFIEIFIESECNPEQWFTSNAMICNCEWICTL